jgi:ATP-dependent DNA helicase HFM1/MER3
MPEVIEKHGNKKPIMIFCMTRNGCIQTAKFLAKLFNATNHQFRLWRGPTAQVNVHDQDLRGKMLNHYCRVSANML